MKLVYGELHFKNNRIFKIIILSGTFFLLINYIYMYKDCK